MSRATGPGRTPGTTARSRGATVRASASGASPLRARGACRASAGESTSLRLWGSAIQAHPPALFGVTVPLTGSVASEAASGPARPARAGRPVLPCAHAAGDASSARPGRGGTGPAAATGSGLPSPCPFSYRSSRHADVRTVRSAGAPCSCPPRSRSGRFVACRPRLAGVAPLPHRLPDRRRRSGAVRRRRSRAVPSWFSSFRYHLGQGPAEALPRRSRNRNDGNRSKQTLARVLAG